MVLLRTKGHLTKAPLPDLRNFLLYCWPAQPKSLQKHSASSYCLQRWKGGLSWRYHALQEKTLLTWTWTESLLPEDSAFTVPVCVMTVPKGERQLTVLLSYDVYEPYQWPAWHVTVLVRQGHTHALAVTNNSDWTYNTHKMEMATGTEKLANDSVRVKPWLL